ncbi:hypothetical protein, partial [Thiolapillus sp.]|uniref:hypothetical protein n=1 Tax=Thiolapillus sp. TaxID=2017437 RepID=UPI0025FB00E0
APMTVIRDMAIFPALKAPRTIHAFIHRTRAKTGILRIYPLNYIEYPAIASPLFYREIHKTG